MSFEGERGNGPLADDRSNSSQDFLQRAASAAESGDGILAVHLYLAAFERALSEGAEPTDATLAGMEAAWNLAIANKQRSLAEYIFDKLEPYWSHDEVDFHGNELQRLAFDKLEELGFPREALEGMADVIGIDAPAADADPEALGDFAGFGFVGGEDAFSEMMQRRIGEHGGFVEDAASEEPSEALRATQDLIRDMVEENLRAAEDAEPIEVEPVAIEPAAAPAPKVPKVSISKIVIPPKEKPAKPAGNVFDYNAIKGFDRAIERMVELGIGRRHDRAYHEFVAMLNERHGVHQPPALGTLMFTCAAREDANCLMAATVGELRLPAIRMRFDRNAAGQTVLVVMTSPDFKSRISNVARSGFEGPAVVLLEDIDTWAVPELDVPTDEMNMGNLMQMQVSRGAREALTLIQVALETPEVVVLVSAADPAATDPYFVDLIGPCRTVELDLPNADERKSLWRSAQAQHPSMRGLDVLQLVAFSNGMSRYEIFAVANEAVEEAYRTSLAQERFCAVPTDDVLVRLSSFQPLDSPEYRQMEDLVAKSFMRDLDKDLDSLLGGQ